MKILDKALDAVGLQRKPKEENQDEELLAKIYGLFEEFRSAYGAEWERQETNELFYLGKHWDLIPMGDPMEPRPVTPIVHSSVENVAADLMRRFPAADITPESPRDEEVARVVGEIIKQNHDASNYKKEYRKLVHDLLVSGYCVQEVGYDPLVNNGIGGSFIRYVDAHNIMFDPQCSDIQDGRAVMKIASRTVNWLEQQYPQFKGQFKTDEYRMQEDKLITYDQSKSVIMIEYWWREFDGQRFKVHMAKVAGRKLLEDSRDKKPEGYFAHGKYPFVVTPLDIRKGSPLGFGLVDSLAPLQIHSDKMDQIVMKNALMASHNKLLVTKSSGFSVDDLRDWSKEVHEGENLNGVTWFATPPLPAYILQYIQSMRDNIKEESGANDFSRGSTNSGVTAASAIAALQEEAAKRSAMAIDQMYEAFRDAVRMEIEVEREYNTLPRKVYLTINGVSIATNFTNAIMSRVGEFGNVVPIEFLVSVKAQSETAWSKIQQNELMLQMKQLQMLQSDQAVELMYFEGKESVLKKATEGRNQPDPQQIAMQQMNEQLQQMPQPNTAIA